MAASRRTQKRQEKALVVSISILFVTLAVTTAYLLVYLARKPVLEPTESYVQPVQTEPELVVGPEAGKAPPASLKAPYLIFVIDDAGHNLWQLEPFLELPFPLTIAVLPGLAYTEAAAARIVGAGKELIVHQPMEAVNGFDSGPGSISQSLPEESIRQILRKNMSQLPQAVGMNNHMGSKATAHAGLMSIVLDEVHQRGWFFLDSGTTADSVVAAVAAKKDIKIWERTVFLDNSPERDYIVNKINEGSRLASKHGYAIMIGHVWSAELAQTLSELYPALIDQGFSLSTIAQMIMEKEDAGSRH